MILNSFLEKEQKLYKIVRLYLDIRVSYECILVKLQTIQTDIQVTYECILVELQTISCQTYKQA